MLFGVMNESRRIRTMEGPTRFVAAPPAFLSGA